jgi:V/A-type H+/Na+-transporting ATPase subunit E
MAEDLQHLIEKIQSEAVVKAESQAADIQSKAKEKAAAIVKEAEKQAAALLSKAETDAEQYTQRSIRTLEQVSRDLLISVGQGVESILDDLVRDSMDEALDIKVIQDMLVRMADTYMARGGKERRIDVLVSPEDQQALVKFYAEKYRKKMGESIEIRPAKSISKGFRVSFVDEHAHHDFTKEAMAEALSKFLRPHLAEIILRVAHEDRNPSSSPNAES